MHVLDNAKNSIQTFDTSGTFVATWGSSGSGDGEFSNPQAVGVDPTGNVFVVDNGNSRVQKFDSAGNYSAQWGTNGSGVNQLSNPYGIAIDSLGDVYVVDGDNYRIQKIVGFGDALVSPTPTMTPTPTAVVTQGTSSSSHTPSVQEYSCGFNKPRTPDLFQVDSMSGFATIYFSPVLEASEYVISYGTTQEANTYNVRYNHAHAEGVLKYTISDLQKGVRYYFKVQAFNNCTPGEWSAVVSTVTFSGSSEVQPLAPIDVKESEIAIPSAQITTDRDEVSPTPTPFSGTVPEEADFTGITVGNEALKPGILVKGVSTVAQVGSVLAIAIVVLPKTGIDLLTSLSLLRDVPFYIIRMVLSLLELLGFRKRVKPWGVVFDSTNGQPIDPAMVTLYRKLGAEQSQISMKITDMAGRFGFLVESGKYLLTVKKTDYAFPSQILAGQSNFKDFNNLYFGNEMSFGSEDLVTVNIPLDPIRKNWNQEVKDQYYKQYHQFFKDRVVNMILLVVLGVNGLLYLIAPTTLNGVLLVISIVLFVLRRLFLHRKKWGVVYDKKTRKVYQGVTVKAVKSIAGKDIDSGMVLTDSSGRYYMLLSEGSQYLQVEQSTENGVKILKRIGPFSMKKETAYNPDIAI